MAILDYVQPYQCNYPDYEFKFEAYRATGCGGQHRNTTDTAIRCVHIPTGVQACSEMKSQAQNKITAKSVVLSRLESRDVEQTSKKHNNKRKQQIGNMGRGGKFIRNYNFIDGRVSDDRVSKQFRPKDIMSGKLNLIYKEV